MVYRSSSSGGTCHENLLLGMPCCRMSFRLENIVPRWEAGNIPKERVQGTYYTCVYVRVERVQGLDRQAERTATLTLASCFLLLLLLCCGRRTAAVDVVHQYNK